MTRFIELTFPTPAENLAFDEALLEMAEEGSHFEILRFWEPQCYFVVLGYSGKATHEAWLETCRKEGIPILRRISGGGTVLQGPGCLNFSLILRLDRLGYPMTLTECNCHVLKTHSKIIRALTNRNIRVEGHTDLTLNHRKFSGNAQRRKKKFFLFHGTFLIDFDISQVSRFLPLPTKQPPYRRNRPHEAFLANLSIPRDRLKETLRRAWQADTPLSRLPHEKTSQLVKDKYTRPEWNFKG